ncbi:hypothetical protein [Streptomyces sp. YIM 121038]|uniref:hypothetical protein n=1 Tax=Streptomyces sp. YIM 121038 TaxID=2136401 RepID=UPI001110093C|nr:hypothetical protein [Streptomyces sp. YIM 121038]
MSETDERLLEALRSVVKESPDRIYAKPEHMPGGETYSCFYVHSTEDGDPSEPGCLVGAVLHRLGISLEDIARYEGEGAAVPLLQFFDDISISATNTFVSVQGLQDDGVSWGEAYRQTTGEDA